MARATKPSPMIAERFHGVAGCEPLVALVEHLAAAPYHDRLFASTSMFSLLLAQTETIHDTQEIIRIDYASDAGFAVVLQERGWQEPIASGSRVFRSSTTAEAISAVERLLIAKGWDR